MHLVHIKQVLVTVVVKVNIIVVNIEEVVLLFIIVVVINAVVELGEHGVIGVLLIAPQLVI
jgi:hypothetical protein